MNATAGGSDVICTREQKQKTEKNTAVCKLRISIGYCRQMLLVREKTPEGILADKLIRWQGYLSWFFSPNPVEVNSWGRDHGRVSII